jgi:hypothetical protein
MIETRDPLEDELSALRPHAISAALRRRVAERLIDSPPEEHRRPRWPALAGGLAAACLAAVIFWWRGDRSLEPKPIVVPSQISVSVDVDDSEPTLLVYHRALSRSPEVLDALLKKQGRSALAANRDPVPMRAFFTRPDTDQHTLPGEL